MTTGAAIFASTAGRDGRPSVAATLSRAEAALATDAGSAAGAGSLTETVLTRSAVVPVVVSAVVVAVSIGADPEDESAAGVDESDPVVDPVSWAGGVGSVVGLSSAGMVDVSDGVDGSEGGSTSCAGGVGS